MKEADPPQKPDIAPVSVSIERILPCRKGYQFIDGFCYESEEATYHAYADARTRLEVVFEHADYIVDLYILEECRDTFYLSELGYRSLIRQKNIQQAYRPEI
ncbi:hypothetical protein [Agarilytica rhodophyticola]|uniref:hypothetical protein n=1 Tax=Agarilytica rhodophyticola TaxID=1737490 RepID=UPI000B345D43|nr:hypothetical protein [Agarilytica rhodophyticola]